jgi:integrase
MKELSARAVESKRKHGRHRVSDNLYLQVGKDGRRSWVFRYQLDGEARMMGLGSADLRTLAEAREIARDMRRKLHLEGVDPLQHRRTERAQAKIKAARSITFEKCAAQFLTANETNWSKKHRRAWSKTLEKYAYPVLGDLPVNQIGKDEVLRCLEPIWTTKPVTAARVRNRIAQVLDWAAARDLRSHDNPAAARKLLPKIKRQVRHLSAMPYAQVPAFMAELRKQEDDAARALEFAILTAARLGEVLGARWDEINLSDWTWEIPGSRMKAGRPHRIPFSKQAVDLLQALPRDGDLVFHRPRHPDRKLHHARPVKMLRRLGYKVTAHGFRSSFRDWAAERTAFPYEVCERALSHVTGSQAARAYARSDLLEERRKLAEAWSAFCSSPPTERGEVVPLRGRA